VFVILLQFFFLHYLLMIMELINIALKVFKKKELNIKVLKCLIKNWQPKIIIIIIYESKNPLTIWISFLFGTIINTNIIFVWKLKEQKLKMKMLSKQKDVTNMINLRSKRNHFMSQGLKCLKKFNINILL